MENWKKIEGCPDYMEVSDSGRVRELEHIQVNKGACGNLRIKGRERKLCPDHQGYMVVNIMRKTHYVHRLVAAAFIGAIPEGMTINHKNGNKADNSVGNLEIVTYSENHLHAFRVLHRKPTCQGKTNTNVSKLVQQLSDDGAVIAEYPSAREAYRQLGISAKLISKSCHGHCRAGGFYWRLAQHN